MPPYYRHPPAPRGGAGGPGAGGPEGQGVASHIKSLLTLSAKTETALRELASCYADSLENYGAQSIPDICFTTNIGRSHFNHRYTI
ncbi:MAG: CurL C-terminal domain-containing protein, partial [Nostoc sp.]